MTKQICLNCHTFKTCSINPKMQNGHYPDYKCFMAKKNNEHKHKSNEYKHKKRGK